MDTYNNCHIANSLGYPQMNGKAERNVQSAEYILKQASLIYLTIEQLSYTQLFWCGNNCEHTLRFSELFLLH